MRFADQIRRISRVRRRSLPYYMRHDGSYVCIEPRGRRIAAMIRRSHSFEVRACHSNGNDWVWSREFPGRISKSHGYRREDLSRTVLSARRESLPVRRRGSKELRKSRSCGHGKRDFAVPMGADCFARRVIAEVFLEMGEYKKRLPDLPDVFVRVRVYMYNFITSTL